MLLEALDRASSECVAGVVIERMSTEKPTEFPIEARWIERPGEDWIVRAREGGVGEAREWGREGVLDEVAIDHWLHMEQMDERSWWFRIGDVWVMASIDELGAVTVDIERGSYGVVRGKTETHPCAEVAGTGERAAPDHTDACAADDGDLDRER